MRGLLEWLGSTSWSIALLESYYVWPFVESTHVLAITLFVGTVSMMDLRLLGVTFRKVPISEFTSRMLPWTRVGFFILLVTGLLLFYSNPVRYPQHLLSLQGIGPTGGGAERMVVPLENPSRRRQVGPGFRPAQRCADRGCGVHRRVG